MVTIPLSSNIVNFFYIALFDVAMPIALTWFIAILLSSVNLKIIHDDRKLLWLRQVPVPHLFNPGVSTRLVGLGVALASGSVVILSIIGSFSINGVSARRSKQVSYIVDRATSENALDLWRHIHVNETGTYFSSTYFAVYLGTKCFSTRKDGIRLYSSIVDTETLESEWTYGLVKNSLKCRSAQFGLETKVAVKLGFTRQSLLWLDSCSVTISPQSGGSAVQVNPTLKGECPFRMLEFFCANIERFLCAGWIESKGETLLFAKEFPKTPESSSNTLWKSGQNYIADSSLSEKPPTESLRSILFLLSGNIIGSAEEAIVMSLLTLKRSGTIKELETVENTIVNETLFIATVAPALVITIGVAFGAHTSRYLFRTKPGRDDYNSFLSARDALLCALNEAKGEGNSKMGTSPSCFITTLDGEPYLVHQKDKMDIYDGV